MPGVLESVSDLTVWSVAKENTFPGSRFEFPAIVFQNESICLTTENPQVVIIQLTAGP